MSVFKTGDLAAIFGGFDHRFIHWTTITEVKELTYYTRVTTTDGVFKDLGDRGSSLSSSDRRHIQPDGPEVRAKIEVQAARAKLAEAARGGFAVSDRALLAAAAALDLEDEPVEGGGL